MGLAERRAVKQFQTEQFTPLKQEIDKAAGFEVAVEVSWDTLAIDDMSHLYNECFPKVYFKPVIEAFKDICQDDMGKEALKETLSKVVMRNTLDSSSPRQFTFEDGVLTIDHKPTSNVDDIKERTKFIVGMMEKAL